MTTEEYNRVRHKSGWSDRILQHIDSEEEAQIYIRAGLKEAIVGGRPALIRTDIDWPAFNCRKEWLKTKLADWDKWKDYNNADLIAKVSLRETPMVTPTNSITSVSARILLSQN